ncbi:DeoR/GlpR family DNA-binding transcription regulator [Glaciihabitans sp. UYNi722]|uniref:DeoR/GlpR family DNA-binding transcription regulator n=1 Tax=Glaciihabitans sp. UYNi722 TaxID=3156344 RepID=UPI003390C993
MRLAAARQSAIVSRAREYGTVRVAELAVLLEVAEMTVRRDIDALVVDHILERVHGGAKLPGSLSTDEPGFERKLAREAREKEAIAQEALTLVEPGAAIGLSAGTTTWRIAKLLSTQSGLTVVTNSVQIAGVFYQQAAESQSTTQVILTGGHHTPSDALVGPIAISALHQLHLDTLFLGVHGMDDGAGFTTPNMLEAETNRSFVAAARRTVVVADHTKWGTVGVSTIARLDEASVLISDGGLSQHARGILGGQVGELRIVGGTSAGKEMN